MNKLAQLFNPRFSVALMKDHNIENEKCHDIKWLFYYNILETRQSSTFLVNYT